MWPLWVAEALGRVLWASERAGVAFVGAMDVKILGVAGVLMAVVGVLLRRRRKA